MIGNVTVSRKIVVNLIIVDNCKPWCYSKNARATIVNFLKEVIVMTDDLACKITGSELEVMKLLWQSNRALSIPEFREELQKSKGWEPATIKTLVGRLVSKGVIRQEKRNIYYYSPLISEKEYNAWATSDLIKRLYNGSARKLVSALVHSDDLTKEDIEELQKMFRVEE